nr:hypothetical protein [Tanacetum cinerariifolium]
ELKRMQNVPYASAVGFIMYVVRCTRPDVAFAQNVTSRFQQNPCDLHWTTVKNILKYLRNTKDMFLVYREAEYIAAFNASKEAVWVRKFISGLGVVPTIEEPISMYCDNTGAIAIANESGITKVVDSGLTDAKKNDFVKGLLFQSIPEDLILQIGNLKIGKEMWEAIKNRNLEVDRVKETRLITLITEFENLKMLDNGNIYEYAAKLSGIASKSATLGEVMSKHKLVKKFLTSLSKRSVHIVAGIKQVLDLKTTRTENYNGNNHLSEGKRRGSYSRGHGRGRDQGRGWGNSQNQGQRDSLKNRKDNEQNGKQHEKCDLIHIQCYHCDQYEHFVLKCPERNRNHEVNLNETQEKSVYHEEEENVSNQVVDEEENPHSSSVHETIPESEEDKSGSDDTSIPIARLETIRLLIALADEKG